MIYSLKFSPMFEGVDVEGGWSILYMLRAQLNLEVYIFFFWLLQARPSAFTPPLLLHGL